MAISPSSDIFNRGIMVDDLARGRRPLKPDDFGGFGSNAITCGAGGQYRTINQAIAAAGSRWAVRKNFYGVDSPTFTATFTNGSASVTVTSTSDCRISMSAASSYVPVTDYLYAGGAYYKIKGSTGNTNITLYESFAGTTGSYTFQYLFLNKITVVLLPGEFDEMVTMVPGVYLRGVSRDMCVFGHDSAFSNTSIVGDNGLSNLTIGPNSGFMSMDNMASSVTTWSGAEFLVENCNLRCGSYGAHNGGGMHFPIPNGGTTKIINSVIELFGNPGDFSGGGVSASKRSSVIMENVQIYNTPSVQSVLGGGFSCFLTDSGVDVMYYTDFILKGVDIIVPDLQHNPSTNMPIGPIWAMEPTSTWLLSGVRSRVANTNASAGASEYPACLVVDGGVVTAVDCDMGATGTNSGGTAGTAMRMSSGTLNVIGGNFTGDLHGVKTTGGTLTIQGANVEGTTNGVNQTTAGTVSIRAGSRVKGGTNSLNVGTGCTANVSANADLIGTTTGAGTINLSTAT